MRIKHIQDRSPLPGLCSIACIAMLTGQDFLAVKRRSPAILRANGACTPIRDGYTVPQIKLILESMTGQKWRQHFLTTPKRPLGTKLSQVDFPSYPILLQVLLTDGDEPEGHTIVYHKGIVYNPCHHRPTNFPDFCRETKRFKLIAPSWLEMNA